MAARNSTTRKSARQVKPTRKPRHKRTATPQDIPPAIEIAVGAQQEAIGITISLLYCLHAALRRELDGGGRSEEMEGAEKAADWTQFTHITAILLVRLNAVYVALDTVSLGQVGDAEDTEL